MIFSVQAMQGHLKTRNFDGEKPGILMGILAVHITTAKIRDTPANEVALGHLGHPGQIGVGWVPQNDVTMEAVRAGGYFPIDPVAHIGNHSPGAPEQSLAAITRVIAITTKWWV